MFAIKTEILNYLQEHRQLPLSSLEEEFKINKEELSKVILELIKDNKIKIKNKRIPIINIKGAAKKTPQKSLNHFIGKKKAKPARIRFKSELYSLIKDELKPKEIKNKEDKKIINNDNLDELKKEINDLKLVMNYNNLVKNLVDVQKENKQIKKEEFLQKREMPFANRQKNFSQDPNVENKVKRLLKEVGFG